MVARLHFDIQKAPSRSRLLLKIQRFSKWGDDVQDNRATTGGKCSRGESIVWIGRRGRCVVLDLKDLTLVDRDAVRFLKRCEAGGIGLKNCPAYIREWIERERT